MFNRKHITNRCRGRSQSRAPELNRYVFSSMSYNFNGLDYVQNLCECQISVQFNLNFFLAFTVETYVR
jgi:hypothetical protein